MYLNYWMKIATPRLCLLWPASRGSSSGWDTVSTCPPMHSILGEGTISNLELSQIIKSNCTFIHVVSNSVLNQPARWNVPIGRMTWTRSFTQNITGSLQTTSRAQTWTLQTLSASAASKRSSVPSVATGNPTLPKSSCDSTNSTGGHIWDKCLHSVTHGCTTLPANILCFVHLLGQRILTKVLRPRITQTSTSCTGAMKRWPSTWPKYSDAVKWNTERTWTSPFRSTPAAAPTASTS